MQLLNEYSLLVYDDCNGAKTALSNQFTNPRDEQIEIGASNEHSSRDERMIIFHFIVDATTNALLLNR